MIGLNVGSGQRPFNSTAEVQWFNIDSQSKWNPDVHCDGSKLPYDKETVDYVVLHHVLEHFGCGEAAALIAEAHRVLKPGGSLVACVPDMWALAQGWAMGKVTTQIYMTNVYGAYMGNEDDRHKWGFDKFSLSEFLSSAAKWDHVSWKPVTIPGADIAHDWWILEVECVK